MVLDVNSVYDMDSTFHPDKKPIQKMVKESLRAGCAVNLIKLALHFIRNHFIWIILLVLSQTVRICYLFFLLNFIELWHLDTGRHEVRRTGSKKDYMGPLESY